MLPILPQKSLIMVNGFIFSKLILEMTLFDVSKNLFLLPKCLIISKEVTF